MIRYAITSGNLCAAPSSTGSATLLRHVLSLARAGVDYLQIREKELPFGQAADLAQQALQQARASGLPMQVLLNAPWPPPLHWPVGVGLHLSTPNLVWLAQQHGGISPPLPAVVSASCHDLHELSLARQYANLLLFAPVFQKQVNGTVVQLGHGLQRLEQFCQAAAPLPVLAMGGVTLNNAQQCMDAGAAGVAGIRLFSARSGNL